MCLRVVLCLYTIVVYMGNKKTKNGVDWDWKGASTTSPTNTSDAIYGLGRLSTLSYFIRVYEGKDIMGWEDGWDGKMTDWDLR